MWLQRNGRENDADLLKSVAGLVAVAIENAKLYQALRVRYEGLKEAAVAACVAGIIVLSAILGMR